MTLATLKMNISGYDEIIFFFPPLFFFLWMKVSTSKSLDMKCVFLGKIVTSRLLHEELKAGNPDIYKTPNTLMETFELLDAPADSWAVPSLVWAAANVQEQMEWRIKTTRLIWPFSLQQSVFGWFKTFGVLGETAVEMKLMGSQGPNSRPKVLFWLLLEWGRKMKLWYMHDRCLHVCLQSSWGDCCVPF